jgi:hypothetical protein
LHCFRYGIIREFSVSEYLGRKLGLAIAFVGFGLVAGTSGMALLVTESDNDPVTAFALAPLPSRDVKPHIWSEAAVPAGEVVAAAKADRAQGAAPCIAGCGGDEAPTIEPVAGATRPVPEWEGAAGENSAPAAPAIPAAPAAPALLGSATVAAAAPPGDESVSEPAAATPPSVEAPAAAPVAPPAKPRKTVRRASQYHASSLWPFDMGYRGGYARQRPFRLFW